MKDLFIAFLFALFCLFFAYGVWACDEDQMFIDSINQECNQSWFACVSWEELRGAENERD